MQKRLLFTNIALVIVVMAFAVFLSWNSITDYFVAQVQEDATSETQLIKMMMEADPTPERDIQSYINDMAEITSLRITMIDNDGTVIADTERAYEHMDNHSNRPEVQGALEGIATSNVRYSNTLRTYMFYYAVPVATEIFDGVLRVSVKVDEIEGYTVSMIRIIFIGVAVGSLLALVLATFMNRRFMNPVNELTRVAKIIAEGDYDEKIYLDREDQLGDLADAFNSMTHVMRKNIWELTRRNAELESILTSMGDGLAAVNNDFRIGLYNSKFMKMLNIPDDDLQNKLFYEVVRELTVFDILEKSIKEQEYLSKETIIPKDGQETIIQITATPIFDKRSVHKHLGALIVLRDITQMRKLENVRRDFVSNVTHELKTPLTSIRGFVDTLKHGAIKDEAVALRFLDIIDIETERLSSLIQDILSLSEIESVVGEKNIDTYDFGQLLHEVVDIIPKDNDKVELIVDIDKHLPPYTCNKNRIKQLMINLIDNSMKYTDQGTVRVRAYEAHGYLNISVADTGVGIERQHLNRIFERFYRVDKGRSRKMGGTGLGLSIVKHITELYNGEVTIESELGEGTTVHIKLPY